MKPRRLALLTLSLGALVPPAEAQELRTNIEVAVETRFFPQSSHFPGQGSERISPSLLFLPELSYEWDDGRWELTGEGFFRIDAHDDNRTHFDARELGLRFDAGRVSAFAGMGRVFWGVTEGNHLVDIVNQTDAVEDLDTEDKLGQPMVQATVEGNWGALDLFYLPYFRERTFPDAGARLTGPLPVGDDAVYESEHERWHPDVAARWFHVLGNFDVGASFFRGTSREPTFVFPPANGGVPELTARYDIIDQIGLDVQWTGEATLLKFEGITRGGHGDRFLATTAGIEHTIFQPFESDGDLGLLAEIMLDSRDETAPPTVFDNDVFVGARWALNDVNDTSVLGGPIVDFETGEVFAILEAERRVGNDWRVEVEARIFGNTEPGSLAHGIRRDGFVTVSVRRFW